MYQTHVFDKLPLAQFSGLRPQSVWQLVLFITDDGNLKIGRRYLIAIDLRVWTITITGEKHRPIAVCVDVCNCHWFCGFCLSWQIWTWLFHWFNWTMTGLSSESCDKGWHVPVLIYHWKKLLFMLSEFFIVKSFCSLIDFKRFYL